MKQKGIINLIKETFSEWSEDKASRLAAALSYYTVFSLAPLLIIVIAVAGFFWGRSAVQDQILTQIQGLIGAQGKDFIQSMMQNVSAQHSTGVFATIVGVITLFIGALGVFGELQNSLNTIWEVKPKPTHGMKEAAVHLVIQRLLSFTMLIVIGFLLLISLVVSAGLAAMGKFIGNVWPIQQFILIVINFVISLGVITLLFAAIYKVLPDAKIAWKDVWLGAFVTAILFSIGRQAIGLYLGRSSVGSTFGAAGSLAIILIWIYYSAQILFLGAEFTQVYANMYGSRIVPDKDAVRVSEGERAQQGIPHGEPQPGALSAAGNPGQAADRLRAGQVKPERMTGWYAPQITRARSGDQRENILNKMFYGFLLASQFIPSLRRLHATKTERTQRTKTTSGSGPAAWN